MLSMHAWIRWWPSVRVSEMEVGNGDVVVGVEWHVHMAGMEMAAAHKGALG